MKNTVQSLLAERRYTVGELNAERDPIARRVIQFSIDNIDRELMQMRQAIPVIHATEVIDSDWSVAQHVRRVA